MSSRIRRANILDELKCIKTFAGLRFCILSGTLLNSEIQEHVNPVNLQKSIMFTQLV